MEQRPTAPIPPAPRSRFFKGLLAASLLTLTGFAHTAIAQTQTPATTPSTRTTDPADAVLDRLLEQDRPTATAPADRRLDPSEFSGALDRSTGAGTAALAPDTRPQRLIREGSFVVDRIGYVRRAENGQDLVFVFAADGDTPASAVDPSMILLPNLNLMAVESALNGDPNRRFRVTGRVTEYRGRNHLMLDKVIVLQ